MSKVYFERVCLLLHVPHKPFPCRSLWRLSNKYGGTFRWGNGYVLLTTVHFILSKKHAKQQDLQVSFQYRLKSSVHRVATSVQPKGVRFPFPSVQAVRRVLQP